MSKKTGQRPLGKGAPGCETRGDREKLGNEKEMSKKVEQGSLGNGALDCETQGDQKRENNSRCFGVRQNICRTESKNGANP